LATVEGLVENDAKTDLLTKQGKTALMLAARFGHHDVLEFLLKKSTPASLGAQDEEGKNALFHAVPLGDEDLCEKLLSVTDPKTGNPVLDIDKSNQRGETVLMVAAASCPPDYIDYLLRKGASLMKQDESTRTALDHAEGNLNAAVVQMLRERIKQEAQDFANDEE